MKLKAKINKLAKQWGVPAQAVLNTYMSERLLVRVSQSSYAPNVVIKGGFLIASIVGISSRSTMDLDATLKGKPLNRIFLEEMLSEIVAIDVGDLVEFSVMKIAEIREDGDYEGFRVSLNASYQGMDFPVKLDLTTGDAITPGAVRYDYPLMLEDASLAVMAYTTETILAEKIETILSRGDQNTRARDFYDLHLLWGQHREKISVALLSEALTATITSRGTEQSILVAGKTIAVIESSSSLRRMWTNYANSYSYASAISYQEVYTSLRDICISLGLI